MNRNPEQLEGCEHCWTYDGPTPTGRKTFHCIHCGKPENSKRGSMMHRFYDVHECERKAYQHWEMSRLAFKDGDTADQCRHERIARDWQERAKAGGYQEGEV